MNTQGKAFMAGVKLGAEQARIRDEPRHREEVKGVVDEANEQIEALTGQLETLEAIITLLNLQSKLRANSHLLVKAEKDYAN